MWPPGGLGFEAACGRKEYEVRKLRVAPIWLHVGSAFDGGGAGSRCGGCLGKVGAEEKIRKYLSMDCGTGVGSARQVLFSSPLKAVFEVSFLNSFSVNFNIWPSL